MHHFTSEDAEAMKELRRHLGTPEDIGPTGRFPMGKLNDDDEGEIKIAIAADPKKQLVYIDFGKPVACIAFTAEQASDLADMIHQKGWASRGISTK